MKCLLFIRPFWFLLVFLASWAGAQQPEIPAVVIHEVHYHHDVETEMAEFIELFNPTTEPVDLSGWSFSEGIDHVFPAGTVLEPGAYYLLVENEDAYNKKFGSIFTGGVKASATWQRGSLSNGGETLTLRDADHEIVDEVDYQDGFPWPVSADGGGASMELIHPLADNDLSGNWRASPGKPSPGKANGSAVENTPPALRQIVHHPREPKSGEAVVVSVKATDPDGVASVHLDLQWVAPGAYIRLTDDAYATAWETMAMNDSGVEGDEVAGDGTFSVTVPSSMIVHRHLVRYRVWAEDAMGQAVVIPYGDDPTPNRAFLVYDGVPPWRGSSDGKPPRREFTAEELTVLPVYHLIADGSDVERCQYQSSSESRRFRGTLVYDGEVYDHIEFKIRGEFSTYQSGKNKWKFFFNRGADFQARDNYGNQYEGGLRVMNFSACASPWVPANRGMSGLDEAVGFRLHRLAGVPSPQTHHLHFRVIDDVEEAPESNQYGGDLWGLYLSQEHPDGRFVNRLGLPDGNTYKIEGGNGDQKHQGPFQSDYGAFVADARRTQTAQWWHANMNMENYYSFRAINRVVANIDIREGWNHYFYHHPDGRWSPVPWDLDMTFMPETHWSGTIDAKNALRVEELAIEFSGRCRELVDLLFSDRTAGGGQVGSVVEEVSQWLGTRKDWITVEAIEKSGSSASVTTVQPHGYTTGDRVTIVGVAGSGYNGDYEINVIDETRFSYKVSIFAVEPSSVEGVQVGKAVGIGSAWSEIDQAMWNEHPRSTGGHKGNFYRNPATQSFQGGVLTRTLATADFSGFAEYVKDFTTDTDPDGFAVGDGDPRGYGYNFLIQESEDGKAPDRPKIHYQGGEGYPVDALSFSSSDFAGGSLFQTQSFAAMEWRLGEIYNPSTPSYEEGTPWRYEIESAWRSPTLTTFERDLTLPSKEVRPGSTYRIRVRHQNQFGAWSHWSEPITFVAGLPDLTDYEALAISELMYHPGPASEAELAAGFRPEDFEYIELYHGGVSELDLTALRFTKGVEFDFDGGTLAPGGLVMVVANEEAFRFRYGDAMPVAGSYRGSLSNGGERLKLSFGAGSPLIDMVYDDGEGWPAESDGGGQSLVPRAMAGDLDLSAGDSWVAGVPSPGKVEGFPPPPRTDAFWIEGIQRMQDGAIELRWRGEIGERYAVEFTETLSLGSLWDRVSEVASEEAVVTFSDRDATRIAHPSGFYRVRRLP